MCHDDVFGANFDLVLSFEPNADEGYYSGGSHGQALPGLSHRAVSLNGAK